MPEEIVDTQEVPVEGGQPPEPTEEPQEPQEPQEPGYITTDQLKEALEKQDSSFRSWLGRRDKETLDHISSVINERLAAQAKSPETSDEMSTRLLENPREVIRSEFESYRNEMTAKETQHLDKTMNTIGGLMESDPLYTDQELGNEVVDEIKKMVQSGKIDRGLPPAQAGKIILGDALSNVFRRRQNAKVNPLSNNTPQNTGSGITPPATPPKKLKVPKLDDETKKWAEKWGYKEEDLARIYAE